MMNGFLTLLAPHLGFAGARRRAGSAHSQAQATPAPVQGMDPASPYAPPATFSEYEFADDRLAVYSSSIVLDYRLPK